eukprot:scaffold5668_cov111-Isochrysis_galbana.AAC.12
MCMPGGQWTNGGWWIGGRVELAAIGATLTTARYLCAMRYERYTRSAVVWRVAGITCIYPARRTIGTPSLGVSCEAHILIAASLPLYLPVSFPPLGGLPGQTRALRCDCRLQPILNGARVPARQLVCNGRHHLLEGLSGGLVSQFEAETLEHERRDLDQLTHRVVGEVELVREARRQARVCAQQSCHRVVIARKDHHQIILVRVAEVDNHVDRLAPELGFALQKRVGLVDEQHAAQS